MVGNWKLFDLGSKIYTGGNHHIWIGIAHVYLCIEAPQIDFCCRDALSWENLFLLLPIEILIVSKLVRILMLLMIIVKEPFS